MRKTQWVCGNADPTLTEYLGIPQEGQLQNNNEDSSENHNNSEVEEDIILDPAARVVRDLVVKTGPFKGLILLNPMLCLSLHFFIFFTVQFLLSLLLLSI